MNDLTVFNYNASVVRTQVSENGEPLFCAADVCAALGYINSRKALADHVSLEDVTKRDTLTNGGNQLLSYVNESGLYALIFGSKLESAMEFKRWVTSEVLPSIRKTGSYSTKQVKPTNQLEQQLEVAKFILDAAGITGNQQALSLNNFVKAKTGEDYLALTGTQLVAPQAKQLLTPTQLGEPLGLSAIKVNKRLEALGLQFKTEAGWQPTDAGLAKGAVMLDTGKRHSSGVPVRQLKWPADILKEC